MEPTLYSTHSARNSMRNVLTICLTKAVAFGTVERESGSAASDFPGARVGKGQPNPNCPHLGTQDPFHRYYQ